MAVYTYVCAHCHNPIYTGRKRVSATHFCNAHCQGLSKAAQLRPLASRAREALNAQHQQRVQAIVGAAFGSLSAREVRLFHLAVKTGYQRGYARGIWRGQRDVRRYQRYGQAPAVERGAAA